MLAVYHKTFCVFYINILYRHVYEDTLTTSISYVIGNSHICVRLCSLQQTVHVNFHTQEYNIFSSSTSSTSQNSSAHVSVHILLKSSKLPPCFR